MSNFTGFLAKRGENAIGERKFEGNPVRYEGKPRLGNLYYYGFIRTMTIPPTQKVFARINAVGDLVVCQIPRESKGVQFTTGIRQWTNIKGKKQHPDRPEVHQSFLSLPSDMPLPKKRHLLQKEFPILESI